MLSTFVTALPVTVTLPRTHSLAAAVQYLYCVLCPLGHCEEDMTSSQAVHSAMIVVYGFEAQRLVSKVSAIISYGRSRSHV